MLPDKVQSVLLIVKDEIYISYHSTLSLSWRTACSKFKVLHLAEPGVEEGKTERFYLVLKILAYVEEKGKHTLWRDWNAAIISFPQC